MGKFYIIFGSFLFVVLTVSLWPMAKYAMNGLDFYFFFVFIPLILLSVALVIIGNFLNRARKKKTVMLSNTNNQTESPSPNKA
ncbi:TPA: hypothetical protein DDW69_04825 [candidate division CPR2 bacterium]|nr:MAG: hypothetical protein A2Y26_01725 [candidate division CPR2 bacterium GWD2_39_7]HBG82125.1 hypothetical protein [candidate division CPR2 bacterium]